jgi:GT2 family glycosyltransferase
MKTVVVVIVHDREANLRRWLDIWSKATKGPKDELRIIHTATNAEIAKRFKALCDSSKVTYIQRQNRGMDIGALQDIVKRRLAGFVHDFDYMMWNTDDVFPMDKDFIQKYTKPFENFGVGVVCYEISQEIRPHIRTLAFCIRDPLIYKLNFPVDPITSKEHCYRFEHRDFCFYDQMIKLGQGVIQVAPLETSIMWDSDHHKKHSREKELSETWGLALPTKKVIVICPAFERYPVICASMLTQTHKDWVLYLVHNGPMPKGYASGFNDERIKIVESLPAKGQWGHPIRKEYLEKITAGEIDGEYVLITNEDNYYAPVFFEKMLAAMEENYDTIATYCNMAHNYRAYNIIDAQLKFGEIDCGAVIIRKQYTSVGWNDMKEASDWTYFESIIARHGAHRWKKVPGVLFVHN